MPCVVNSSAAASISARRVSALRARRLSAGVRDAAVAALAIAIPSWRVVPEIVEVVARSQATTPKPLASLPAYLIVSDIRNGMRTTLLPIEGKGHGDERLINP